MANSTYTPHELRLTNCTWLDVNPQFTNNLQPERFADVISVLYSSFFNLMNCPIGARGRIFQPEYGSSLMWFLQESISEITAQKMRLAVMQIFGRWEPRIDLDYRNTQITPDYSLPGYRIRISGTFKLNKQYASVDFAVRQQ